MEEKCFGYRIPDPVWIEVEFQRCKNDNDFEKFDGIEDDYQADKGKEVLCADAHVQSQIVHGLERFKELEDQEIKIMIPYR